ncbi:glycosyltransferase [Geotoga petraea]|uniref:Glycosyltransferase involved in cell wall bisynthesis n=1 Tax=Geotoga petraea TaxID=28234 RepID=A0A1G6PKD0_9BACT|nr:glycosyltransferase [Geotoga petraea]SDC79857.1 Glycosyltransferase involved in cell wall bisynthesis [Geotoga petraea]
MNVLIITRHYKRGGSETYLARKIRWYIDNNYNILLLVPKKGEIEKDFPDIFNKIDIIYYPKIEVNPSFFKKNKRKIDEQIINKINRFNPDFIESHNYPAGFWGDEISSKIKVKNFILLLTQKIKFGEINNLNLIRKQYNEKRLLPLNPFESNELLSINNILVEKIWDDKIYFPVSFSNDFIKNNEIPNNDVTKKIKNLKDNNYTIISTVCRLEPNRSDYISLLIEKYREIKEIIGNVVFLVVGNGTLFNNYKNKAKKIDKNIVFVGEVYPDPNYIYKLSDIYVGSAGTTSINSMLVSTPTIICDSKGKWFRIPFFNDSVFTSVDMKTDYTDFTQVLKLLLQKYKKIKEIQNNKSENEFSEDLVNKRFIKYATNYQHEIVNYNYEKTLYIKKNILKKFIVENLKYLPEKLIIKGWFFKKFLEGRL